ncbi:hypothetical protein EPO05_05055 [Patescibacteria group bacterium]|nr:MAG: hypothetical protein EPO05_05055 [Patescibacteria group bacterium]
MPLNCQQLHEQLKKLQELKGQFDAALAATDLNLADSLQKNIQAYFEIIGDPKFQFDRWAKKHGLEGKAERIELVVGGMAKEELKAKLEENQTLFLYNASGMIDDDGFVLSPEQTRLNLVKISAYDMVGDTTPITTEEILEAARKIGLQFCPAEVGPRLSLQLGRQAYYTEMNIAMDPISIAEKAYIFVILNIFEEPRIKSREFIADEKQNVGIEFVFCLPPGADWNQ